MDDEKQNVDNVSNESERRIGAQINDEQETLDIAEDIMRIFSFDDLDEIEEIFHENGTKEFKKWIKTFEMQIKHNISFDHTTFSEIVKMYESSPKIAIKLKYNNYTTPLDKKTYLLILQSFIGWVLTLQCEYSRCNGKYKLKCFCDVDEFQLYAYNIIIGLIKCNTNNTKSPLDVLTAIKNTVSTMANALCNILPKDVHKNKYCGIFKKYIIKWLQHELYNFKCIDCGYINKTIMINRIYEYSITLNYCRFCNKLQESRIKQNPNQAKFDMNIAIQQKLKQQYTHHMNDGYIYAANDKNKKYPIYYVSPAVRYLSINPKYSSFAQEILLNRMYSLDQTEWNKWLEIGKKLYDKYVELNELESNQTNIDYGIERYEQIGINHLIAVRIFCDNEEYGDEFNKSYWFYRTDLQIISNNFYWMGRCLYEIVQFFGTDFDKINEPLYYKLSKEMMFDSFAPPINQPIIAYTPTNILKSFANKDGTLLQIKPKYDREINQTKVISLNKLFKKAEKKKWYMISLIICSQ